MTVILCQSLKPSKYGYGGDLHGLGIRHDSHWLVPSQLLEPFYPFLKLHNEEGLELIQKIVNHSTLAWRIRERDKSPVIHTLKLENKTLNIWGDDLVYRWYRFSSLGSGAVCCALMALEKWMDESIKEGKDLKTLFTKVLSGTNCAALVGVCSSVALANFSKADLSIIVSFLENPVYWLMDERRLTYDLYECKSILNGWFFFDKPNAIKFHKRISEQPHREIKFSDFVPAVLVSQNQTLKERLVNKMQSFEDNPPQYFKKMPPYLADWHHGSDLEQVKRSCRLWALQADINNYRRIEQDGKIGLAFYAPDHFTDEDNDATNTAEEHIQIGTYRIWAYEFLENNEIKPNLTISEAIDYAKQLEDHLEEKDDMSHIWGIDFITNLSAALIVQKWDFIVKENLVDWCMSKIIIAGNMQGNETEVGVNPQSFDRAVAHALPHLYKQSKTKPIEKLLKQFSQHRVHEVRHILFNNLKILWGVDSKLIWKCTNDLIKISTKSKKLSKCNPKEVFSSALMSVLFIIPKDKKLFELKENKNILIFIDELLDFTIESYIVFQKQNRDYNQWHYFEWNKIFFALLANSILDSEEQFFTRSLKKISTHWKKSPGMLEEFLRQFLIVSLNREPEQKYYDLWKNLCESLIQSEDLTNYGGDHKKEILGLLIFEDSLAKYEWKEMHRLWLREHIPLIKIWCEKFGNYREYFPSLIRMLDSNGFELMIEYGLTWLQTILLSISNKKSFLKNSRITSEFDSLLWKTWEKHKEQILQNGTNFEQFSFLVDLLADQEKPYSRSLQKLLEKEKQGT